MVSLTLLFIAYKQHCSIYGLTPRRILEVTASYTCIKEYKSFSWENGAADCMVRAHTSPQRDLKPAVGANDCYFCITANSSQQIITQSIVL